MRCISPRAFLHSRGVENEKGPALLNVGLPEKKNFGARVRAYRQLAVALTQYQDQKFAAYDTVEAELKRKMAVA